MGIKYTADNNVSDVTYGGHSTEAANWTKTFTDFHQADLRHGDYMKAGELGYGATNHLPYYYSLTVLPRSDPGTGSYDSDGANRYYPVSFRSGSVRRASSAPNLIIYRGYNINGPYQFEQNNSVDIGWTGSSTHQGGLYASYHVGDSAWSDMYESQLTRYRLTYHTCISSHGMRLSFSADRGSGPFFLMLRGGFSYYINSSYPTNPTQVKAGGGVFTYGGNDAYQTWPASTTSVSDTTYNSSVTTMG